MTPPRKTCAVYAITRHGVATARRLRQALPEAELFVSERLLAEAGDGCRPLPLPMGPLLADVFLAYDCHLFIISVGAVVRMIAPLLKNKKVDPAVVCVDDASRFTICVLSGHVGRGNAFTERFSRILGNQAVVTTASDVLGTLTVDILGRELGWTLDDPDRNVTRGCAAVVNARRVLFVQECGEPGWWPESDPLPPGVEYATSLAGVDPAAFEILLIASDRDLQTSHPAHWDNSVIYRPRTLVLGLGCDRDTPADLVERGVQHLLQTNGLSVRSVKEVATVDRKQDETALLQLCERHGWPLRVFTAAQLSAVPGIENPSATVLKHVGTPGVSEPAALLASGATRLLLTKQIYTEAGAGRSMTLAAARIPHPPRRHSQQAQG